MKAEGLQGLEDELIIPPIQYMSVVATQPVNPFFRLEKIRGQGKTTNQQKIL